mgnify:FL=1
MKPFQNVVREINKTLNQLILFENIVNTTLVFLAFYLILSVIDFHPLFALVPALIYLGFYSYMGSKSSKPLII